MSAWRLFWRDHWRALAFFIAGMGLMLAVIVLDVRAIHHYTLPLVDVVYAAGLGLLVMIAYLGLEYGRRRRFYQGELREARTEEQRLFLQSMQKHQYETNNKLHAIEEKRRFYELFVTRFAHQMKTPLTVIQLLENELRDSGQGEFAGSLGDERARLDAALNTMLHTARLTAFSFDAQMETVELLALLREGVNEHKTAWIRYKLFPKIESVEDRIHVQTDRKWLAFLCDQIMRNALQYGIKTTPATFQICVREEQAAVEIDFIDEGIGIPAQDIRRVFEPFYTGANGRTHSRATGMGLYLVKEVADRLGHEVRISSQEGEGTTVTIRVARADYHAVAGDKIVTSL